MPHYQLGNQHAIITTRTNIMPGRLNRNHKVMNVQLFFMDSVCAKWLRMATDDFKLEKTSLSMLGKLKTSNNKAVDS